MNVHFAHLKFKRLVQQRYLLVGLTVLLLLTNILLAISVFVKDERVIVLPPELKQGIWAEKGQVSTSYLEEMGVYFAHLMLDHTPSTASFQRDILLRYAVPKEYGALKAQLIADEEGLKKDNLSTQFLPLEITVTPGHTTVYITGELLGYVGEKQIFQKHETYELKLVLIRGRLMIESFKSLGDKKEND